MGKRDDFYKHNVAKLARGYARKMHSPLVMCSSKTSTHVRQVFTVVVGSVFQIKIHSRKRHQEKDEPLLEYDVIYKGKKHKKRRASVHLTANSLRMSSNNLKSKKPPSLMRSSSLADNEVEWPFTSCLKFRIFDHKDEDDEKEDAVNVKSKENDDMASAKANGSPLKIA